MIAYVSNMVENQKSYIGSYIRFFEKSYIGILSYRLHRKIPTVLSEVGKACVHISILTRIISVKLLQKLRNYSNSKMKVGHNSNFFPQVILLVSTPPILNTFTFDASECHKKEGWLYGTPEANAEAG